MRWELEVGNATPHPVVLSFRTSQRADVVLERHGEVVYRWSEGHMFLQVLGEQLLAPGESWTFALAGRLDVEPGEYEAIATLVSEPPVAPGRARVVVEG